MVTTARGVAVLEDHRQKQTSLASRSIAQAIALSTLWTDPRATTESRNRWLAAMLTLIRRDKTASAALARAYYGAYRVVELGRDVEPFEFDPQVDFNEEQILSSMLATGPYAFERARQAAEGQPARQKVEQMVASNAGAVQRHVQNGAREVVDDVLARDPQKRGYMRLTDGDPCFFCAMLASRGPVYDDESFEDSDERFQGPGQHKVHDSCGCSLVPIYGPPVAMAGFKAYDALWAESTQGKSGRSAINAFRSAYEAQRRSRTSP